MTEAPAAATTWRALLRDATARLGDRDDARRIVEEASGWSPAELIVHLDEPSTVLTAKRCAAMVERRAAGEPVQYVLGRWGFRALDLLVDRRVLIPRPETEHVVSLALEALDAIESPAPVAVDLGTGSGAIALALAFERPSLAVWATDASADALAVARANLAGIGRAATRVRLVEGDWYGALPAELRGDVDLIVSNPPYVADRDELPVEVAGWEPAGALRGGPEGLDHIAPIVEHAAEWLRERGALVVEIGEDQADAVLVLAERAGFASAVVRPDLTGRPRALVATAR